MGTKLTKLLNFTKLENFVPFIIVLVILCAAKPALHNKQVRVIVIDAGHGGKDPGCNYNGVKEKDVTLQIALATGKKIQELLPDVKIIYTRNSDRFIELHQRAEIANKAEADLFISIHCNANKNVNVSGTETFAMGLHKANDNLDVSMRENGAILLESNYQENYEGFDPNSPETHIILSLYQNAYLEKSLKLASKIEQNLGKQIERFSRGVKQAGLIGHSWGSLIALEAAAKLKDRITHLALVGTAFPMKVSFAAIVATAADMKLVAAVDPST